MLNIEKYGYLIFDCDGVILDSNYLKTEAYAKTLAGEPDECVARFLEYHKRNGGISRYHKFQYYYQQIRPAADIKVKVQDALARFSQIVRKGMIECAYIPGVIDFIKTAKQKGLRLFVASGSDEEELKDVFRQRGINGYFEKIFGSPATKNESTGKILAIVGLENKGLFLGDSQSDIDAAKKFGLDFIFVRCASQLPVDPDTIRQQGHLIINDFTFKNTGEA